MRLSDVDTWELAGFQNQLICCFMLAEDVVGGGIWEFVNDMDGPGMGAGGIGCGWVPVGQSSQLCKWNGAHLHVQRASDPFLQCKML